MAWQTGRIGFAFARSCSGGGGRGEKPEAAAKPQLFKEIGLLAH
jgi:hypothetical protein